MKIIKTVIFGILFLMMSTYYYFYEVKRFEEIRRQKEEEKKVFAGIKKEDIHAFTIKGKNGETHLQREGEGWIVKSPVTAEGDAKTAEFVVENLAAFKMQTVIAETPKDYKDFGLEDPALTITFTAAKDEMSLLIGDDNPTGTLVYGRTGSKPRIFTFPPDKKKQLNKSIYDLRDKSILSLERDKIRRISVAGAGVRLDAVLAEDETWKITKPFQWRADKEKLEGIIRTVVNSKIEKFVSEEPKDLGKFGLEKPSAVLKFFSAEGDGKETVSALWIGKKEDGQNSYFAKREDARNVFLIDDKLIKKIPGEAEDFRDKKLLPLEDSTKIVKLRFSGSEMILVEKNDEGDWKLLEPLEAKADLFETNQWIDRITKIEAEEFLDGRDKNATEFGLNSPAVTVELWEKDEEVSKKVLFGHETEGGKARYAALVDEAGIFAVSDEMYQGVLITAMKLRDKRLISYDTEDVQTIKIQKGNNRAELKRSGNKWTVEPSGKKLEGNPVRSLLWNIMDLSFDSVSAEGENDLDRLGLAEPSLSIKILQKNNKKAGEIYFGKELTGKGDKAEEKVSAARYYAMNGDRKEVYEVNTDLVKEINKKFKDWGIKP